MKARLIDTGLKSPKTIRIKEVDQFYLDTPFHFHESCEIVLIKESHGKRVVGDHVANFNEGDLVLMGPNLPHIWQNNSIYFLKKKDYKVKATVIYFSPSFLIDLADDYQSVKKIESFLQNISRGLQFKGKTQQIAAEKLAGISEMEGLRKIMQFIDIVDLLSTSDEYEYLASEGYRNSYTFKDTARFNDVYQFLMNNFHRAIPLEEVAGIAKMSPTAFCRYFKNHTQKSLVQFVNELRIGHACKLLENKDHSITDVSYECGYNNMVNFNKFFKEVKGKTPSDYRKDLNGSY
jgi:AraC-like DNA-binding protein